MGRRVIEFSVNPPFLAAPRVRVKHHTRDETAAARTCPAKHHNLLYWHQRPAKQHL
jgi:hypothetical protein